MHTDYEITDIRVMILCHNSAQDKSPYILQVNIVAPKILSIVGLASLISSKFIYGGRSVSLDVARIELAGKWQTSAEHHTQRCFSLVNIVLTGCWMQRANSLDQTYGGNQWSLLYLHYDWLCSRNRINRLFLVAKQRKITIFKVTIAQISDSI